MKENLMENNKAEKPEAGIKTNYEDKGSNCWYVVGINKRTLETVILNYDEKGTKLGVVNSLYGDAMFEYESSQALSRAISDIKNRYENENYAWSWGRRETPIDMEDIAKGHNIKPKPLLLNLFTPHGQLTHVEKALEGQKKIPCKRRVFINNKTLAYSGQILCDESGRRIFKCFFNPRPTQHLWTFETDEEMQTAYDNMKTEYLHDGYELTFDETVDYAFDYSLELFNNTYMKQAENKH